MIRTPVVRTVCDNIIASLILSDKNFNFNFFFVSHNVQCNFDVLMRINSADFLHFSLQFLTRIANAIAFFASESFL